MSEPVASLPTRGERAVAPDDGSAPRVSIRWNRRGDDAEVEVVGSRADAPAADPHEVDALTGAIAEVLDGLVGATPHLAGEHPAHTLDPLIEAVADASGFSDRRDLLQLRRGLPVPAHHRIRATAPAVATRPFVPGGDDEAWIRVNNRSFASHPDQGHQTAATLAAQVDEPWFDADGFLVADDPSRPGELAGFCWTKVHEPTDVDPALGEIYVIGVDPSHRGEGLGPSFVLAGLDHLARQGLDTAVLYVDAENEPARRLYDRLDFTTHRRRRVYTRPSRGVAR